MVRTNQGGSVLSFIVIGVILAALLVGGAYTVRRQTVPSTQPTPTTDKPVTKPSQNEKKQDEKSGDKEPREAENHPTIAPTENPPIPTTSTSPSTLPQTGPIETTGALIALAFLSAAAVSYARSRRPGLSL